MNWQTSEHWHHWIQESRQTPLDKEYLRRRWAELISDAVDDNWLHQSDVAPVEAFSSTWKVYEVTIGTKEFHSDIRDAMRRNMYSESFDYRNDSYYRRGQVNTTQSYTIPQINQCQIIQGRRVGKPLDGNHYNGAAIPVLLQRLPPLRHLGVKQRQHKISTNMSQMDTTT